MKGFEDISEYVSHITKDEVKEEFYFYYIFNKDSIAFMNTESFNRIVFKIEDYKLWVRTKKIKKIKDVQTKI